jgi:hypothetical protein
MNELNNAVELALADNAAEFSSAISNILASKLRDRIDVEKVAVAQKFFNQSDEDNNDQIENEEEDSDEDV